MPPLTAPPRSRESCLRAAARQGARLWIPLLVGGLVFLAVRNVVLNLFYVEGMYFLDAGWFAHMPWRNDWVLTSPPGHPAGEVPFLRRHLAFVLLPLNALSHVVDTDHAAFFALWFAAIFVFGFWVGWLLASDALRRAGTGPLRSALLASAFGALFALNGVSLSTVLYPHPEILMAFAIAGLFWASERDRPGLALMFGAVALSTRTDGGFHVALFATACAVAVLAGNRFELRDPRARRYALLAVFAFAYSAIGYAVQSRFVPGTGQFTDIYSGPGFFAHLTPELVAGRLRGYLHERLYAFAGFGACLLAFVVTRRPVLLLGALACLPWLAIQLVAFSEAAGGLFSYYAFPFVVLLAWPLIVRADASPGAARRLFIVALIGGLFSTGLALGPGGQQRILGYVALRATAPEMQRLRFALSTLVGQLPSNELRLDGAVLSLVARDVGQSSLFFPDRDQTGVTTVLFFDRYMDASSIRRTFTGPGLEVECALPRTPLRLLTSRPAHQALARSAGFSCPESRAG